MLYPPPPSMACEAARCYVCFEESGTLERLCACATVAHRSCVERAVQDVPSYGRVTCPVCSQAFRMHASSRSWSLRWNCEGVAIMGFVLYESLVALLPFVVLSIILACNDMIDAAARAMQMGALAYAMLVVVTASIVHATLARDGRTIACCELRSVRTWVWEDGACV